MQPNFPQANFARMLFNFKLVLVASGSIYAITSINPKGCSALGEHIRQGNYTSALLDVSAITLSVAVFPLWCAAHAAMRLGYLQPVSMLMTNAMIDSGLKSTQQLIHSSRSFSHNSDQYRLLAYKDCTDDIVRKSAGEVNEKSAFCDKVVNVFGLDTVFSPKHVVCRYVTTPELQQLMIIHPDYRSFEQKCLGQFVKMGGVITSPEEIFVSTSLIVRLIGACGVHVQSMEGTTNPLRNTFVRAEERQQFLEAARVSAMAQTEQDLSCSGLEPDLVVDNV